MPLLLLLLLLLHLLLLLLLLLQQAFESDKVSRQERELQLAKRLGDLEYRTEAKFEAEKVFNPYTNAYHT